MKNTILIFIFGLLTFTTQAQKGLKDTSEMCIPYSVAQKMLIDLNDYDRLKEISKLDKKEINELNNKIILLEKVNQTWIEKDSLSKEIILETENKVEIYKEENERLADDNKRLKTKNTIFNIISGAIIAPLTYLALFK
jgi:hypothetical protein